MRDFTIGEILDACKGQLISGQRNNIVYGVCTDSRIAKPGDIFFPLIGEKNDGHDFLQQVMEAGCKSIIVSDESKVPKTAFLHQAGDTDIIVVDDTTKALQDLAVYYLGTMPLKKKIAVTGSVGKTSTRDMLYYVASAKYKTGRNPKNFNNGFGIPLSILEFEPDTQIAVLEMGISSPGEMEKLARLVRPDIAVITNIGVSHIENLGSREGILREKLNVTSYFDSNATLIVNSDNDMLTEENVSGNYNVIKVGSSRDCDYRISDICDFGDKGIKYSLDSRGKKYEVKLNVLGAHNGINATLAIAAGNLLGISEEEAISGLERAELTEKRLNIRNTDKIKVIDDTYNACPDSMISAINTLASTEIEEGGRRIAILGDMFELGQESARAHKQVGAYAAEKKIDVIIAVGSHAEYYAKGAASMGNDRVMYYPKKSELLSKISEVVKDKDVVLVKASRGMAMEEVVKEIIKDNKDKE